MKIKIILLLALTCLITGVSVSKEVAILKRYSSNNPKKSSSQNKNREGETNYTTADRVLVIVNGHEMKLSAITPVTAKTIYGKPLSEKTEFSEVDNANVMTYKYKGGEISFLRNHLNNVAAEGVGFSFIFLKANGSKLTFKPGSACNELYNTFTTSWKNGTDKNVHVFMKTNTGVVSDAFIVFSLSADLNNHRTNTIKAISFGY